MLPRHDESDGRAVLLGQGPAVNARGQQRERVHRFVQPQPFVVRPRVVWRAPHARRLLGAVGGLKTGELPLRRGGAFFNTPPAPKTGSGPDYRPSFPAT